MNKITYLMNMYPALNIPDVLLLYCIYLLS